MPRSLHVAKVGDLKPGQMKAVEVDDKRIVVANLAGSYVAFDGTCTHAGGPLEEGDIQGDVVTCPWHGGQFNCRTGKVESPPPMEDIATYTVKVAGQDIQVEVP